MSTTADFDGIVDAEPAWADVPQLSVPCVAVGGSGGSMNAQAVAIVQRLNWLKQNTGSRIFNGTTAPVNTLGSEGDYYINVTDGKLYGPKYASYPDGDGGILAWIIPGLSPVSLRGVTGPTGGGVARATVIRYDATHAGGSAYDTYFWTAPEDGLYRFEDWGAGGSGGAGTSYGSGAYNGSGGYVEKTVFLKKDQVVECNVGRGGQAVANSPGVAGGDTSAGTTSLIPGSDSFYIRAGGGGGAGGTATGGDVNIPGAYGNRGWLGGSVASPLLYGSNGASAPRGGVGGQGVGDSTNGFAGGTPGGGGGGTMGAGGSGYTSGRGGDGLIVIWH